MLDISLLEQYAALRERLQEERQKAANVQKLLRQLEREEVADIVSGSRADLSYGPIKVKGRPDRDIQRAKQRIYEFQRSSERLEGELYSLLDECEKWMEENVQNSPRVRLVLRQRYIDGDTWGDIARRMGTTPQCPKQMLGRYLRGELKKP